MEYLAPYFDEEDKERAFDCPYIQVATTDGQFLLTHINSRVRLFPNSMLNHIEYIDDNDDLIAVVPTQELMNEMLKRNWPVYSLPYVDQSSGDWFVSRALEALTEELKML